MTPRPLRPVLLLALLALAPAAAAPSAWAASCDALGGDLDGDGICDDGDASSVIGDAPCSCLPDDPASCTVGCDDNCRYVPNLAQLDIGGLDGVPDGVGTACQCADVNDDGDVDMVDAVIYARTLGALPPGFAVPGRCEVVAGPGCDLFDLLAVRTALAGSSPGISQDCAAAVGCTLDSECAAGEICGPFGVCGAADGTACLDSSECASGSCSDGVCCESACAGTCEQCDAPGRLGFCDPVASGLDPDSECPTEATSTCGQAGYCSGARSCALWPADTECQAPGCLDSQTIAHADVCDGNGSCVDGGQSLCAFPNASGICVPPGLCALGSCDAGTSSCDGNDANGCEIEHAAVSGSCGTGSQAGTYDGDRNCGFICGGNTSWDTFSTFTGNTSRWFRARVREDSDCPADIEHRVRLSVPAGTNFDLYVYRTCGVPAGSSQSGPGIDESVIIRESDNTSSDDSFDYYVEVRWVSGSSCAFYTVHFDGHNC